MDIPRFQLGTIGEEGNRDRSGEIDGLRSDGHAWFKSTASGNADCCVEVSLREDGVLVRDSKFGRDPANAGVDRLILAYTRDAWSDFIAGVKAGEFDFE
jgi:hypothetical protein